MSEILKSLTRNPKKPSAFFANVFWFSFLLEIFSTLLTLHCLKCLFHMNSRIKQVVNVIFVANVSRWNATSENISKKSTWFFLVPGRRFQYFRHLLQNPNLKVMASFSNNHYWPYTFPNHWALKFYSVPVLLCSPISPFAQLNYFLFIPFQLFSCFQI